MLILICILSMGLNLWFILNSFSFNKKSKMEGPLISVEKMPEGSLFEYQTIC